MEKHQAKWGEDPRFRQCNREFIATLILFTLHVVLVVGLSVIFGHGVNGENTTMIFGLPGWFFWGGFVTSGIFCIASIIMVIFFFKDMPLDADDND